MCVPSKYIYIYIKIQTLIVMFLGGGAFGRYLSHESGAFMNGIGALIKETRVSSLSPHFAA